jgi:hypothetical protein
MVVVVVVVVVLGCGVVVVAEDVVVETDVWREADGTAAGPPQAVSASANVATKATRSRPLPPSTLRRRMVEWRPFQRFIPGFLLAVPTRDQSRWNNTAWPFLYRANVIKPMPRVCAPFSFFD